MGITSSAVAWTLVYAIILALTAQEHHSNAALSPETLKLIEAANIDGPYLGLVIPNTYELNPLLQSPNFTSTHLTIDFSGKHIYIIKFVQLHSHEFYLFTYLPHVCVYVSFLLRKEIPVWNHCRKESHISYDRTGNGTNNAFNFILVSFLI